MGRVGYREGKGVPALIPGQPLPSLCYFRSLVLILPRLSNSPQTPAVTLKATTSRQPSRETQQSCRVKAPRPHVHSQAGPVFPRCVLGPAQHVTQVGGQHAQSSGCVLVSRPGCECGQGAGRAVRLALWGVLCLGQQCWCWGQSPMLKSSLCHS